MYTKDIYKNEILEFIRSKGYDPMMVAKKTFTIFFNYQKDIGNDLYERLIDVFTMEEGPEFEMTEEEFNEFLKKM